MDDSAAATTATRLPATSLNRSSFQPLPNQNQNGTTTRTKSLLNLDTLSLKSASYTSLQDVLPFTAAATVNSPTASSATHEISIRNRLVKQAAWAYLQPISPSPSSPSGPQFLHHLRQTLSSDSRSRRRRNPLTACLSFVSHVVPCFTRVLHRILHAIWTQVQAPILHPPLPPPNIQCENRCQPSLFWTLVSLKRCGGYLVMMGNWEATSCSCLGNYFASS